MVDSTTGRAVAVCDGTIGEAIEMFAPASCRRGGMNAVVLNEYPGDSARLFARPSPALRWWHVADLGHVLDAAERTQALALELEGMADELDDDVAGERWARMACDELAADALMAAVALRHLDDIEPDPDRYRSPR